MVVISNKDNRYHHTATHCNTLQHTAPHCTTLQLIATHCDTLPHTVLKHRTATQQHCKTFSGTRVAILFLCSAATHCTSMQHTATHCNALQKLQRIATNCNKLQQTATQQHCKIMNGKRVASLFPCSAATHCT